MINSLLKITDLNASVFTKDEKEKKKILHNLSLEIQKNEVHVIMGPNGSGKSTLSKIITGHPSYEIDSGEILFCNENLAEMDSVTRSHKGLFLAFQYPLEIAGVTNFDFLRLAFNEKQKYLNEKELTPIEFFSFLQTKIEELEIQKEFLYRNVNEGFSGGEKKRNEILQFLLLQPKLLLLDEIDSGLDIDAIKFLGKKIQTLLSKDSSILLITHYPKLLEYIEPTHIHIFMEGKILYTGGKEILKKLETFGYSSFSSL
jgi:Fe-S cluster assembly ATP-binding protein